MLFVDVDGCTYGGGKMRARERGSADRQRKITCRDVTREIRRSPWSEPRHDRSLFLPLFLLLIKEDARAVALRDLLLFFAFNLTWPGRVEVGWHETSQSN